MDEESGLARSVRVAVFAATAGRTNEGLVEFDVTGFPAGSLWHKALNVLAQQSSVRPRSAAHVFSLKRTFALLSPSCWDKLRRAAIDFDRDSFWEFLRDIDTELGSVESWSLSTRFDNASRFRGFLAGSSDVLSDGRTLEHALNGYRTPLRSISPGRVIPKSAFGPAFSQPMIAALDHDSMDDLRRKAREQIHARLEQVRTACISEFEAYFSVCNFQQKCISVEVPPKAQRRILTIATQGYAGTSGINTPWARYDPIWIASVVLHHLDAQAQFCGQPGGSYGCLNLPTDFTAPTLLGIERYRFAKSVQPYFFARYRLPNRVMTAMFVYLLERTGWNVGALGTLSLDGISRDRGKLILQALKAKTDDQTPRYEVPRTEVWTYTVIEMLERNRLCLIAHGFIADSEKRLWFGWQRAGYHDVTNHVHQLALADFIKRHNLTRFAPSELRPVKAAAVYLDNNDLRAVQLLLGHTRLETTEGYLVDTLFYHLNEAKSLQYARTIEATLLFATQDEVANIAEKIDKRFVDKGLLFATGDGGTCSNPYSPPPPLAPGAPCDGLRCHIDGGCPNYSLRISATTLESAIRTREFYRNRWDDLMRKNELAFKRLHVPRIVFIHVLLRVVAEKRPALFRAAVANFSKGAA